MKIDGPQFPFIMLPICILSAVISNVVMSKYDSCQEFSAKNKGKIWYETIGFVGAMLGIFGTIGGLVSLAMCFTVAASFIFT